MSEIEPSKFFPRHADMGMQEDMTNAKLSHMSEQDDDSRRDKSQCRMVGWDRARKRGACSASILTLGYFGFYTFVTHLEEGRSRGQPT